MNASEMQNVIDSVKYKDWLILVMSNGHSIYLQVRFMAQDLETGTWEVQHGRKWLLSEYMTKSEIVQTALKAVLTAEEHETREKFTVDGRAIFNPHIDIDALMVASALQTRR